LRTLGRRDERRRGTRTCTEISDRQRLEILTAVHPVGCEQDAPGESLNVEPILARVHVDRFFLTRQQIEKQRPETVGLEKLGDGAIAAAEPAASAAVREYHEPVRVCWYSQIGLDLTSVHRIASDSSTRRTAWILLSGLLTIALSEVESSRSQSTIRARLHAGPSACRMRL
jgi:hypothetical protein